VVVVTEWPLLEKVRNRDCNAAKPRASCFCGSRQLAALQRVTEMPAFAVGYARMCLRSGISSFGVVAAGFAPSFGWVVAAVVLS
jgi:hypothetical protein